MSDSGNINGFDVAGNMRRPRVHLELIGNYLIDLISIHTRQRMFRPLITNFYVTQKCNLRCIYCFPPGDELDSDLNLNIALLKKIRPHSPVINFTGGEPLLYPHLSDMIKKARELRFYPILLSTNALLMNRLEKLLPHIDHLIVSLDSVKEETNDAMAGVRGVSGDIIENIIKCAKLVHLYGHQMSIHSVISPRNLDDIAETAGFCDRLNITFSISPQHDRYNPSPELIDSPTYTAVIDNLIDLKMRGMPIVCSLGYLRAIREFRRRRCYPYVSPRVFPDGSVYFPCERIRDTRLSLHDYDSLISLMRKHAQFSNRTECANRCYLACYVEVEQYFRKPLSILREIPLMRVVSGRSTGREKNAPN